MIDNLNDLQEWISDLNTAIETIDISDVSGNSVLVTGASGLICSAVVDLLIRFNEDHSGKVNIYAAGRNPEKIKSRFGIYSARPYFHTVEYDATKELKGFPNKIDYIIHGAGNAYPDAFMKEPVETMVSNFSGTHKLLDYAKDHKCKKILYISSSEVYGKKEHEGSFREDDYGFIDILNPRSSYSIGKQAGETLCVSYSDEYGLETVIARPGHIYGPTASKSDNRVASAFSYLAARGADIVMKSAGTQIRSYVYCVDCATAILSILLKGKSGFSYNISNPESVISIRKMAEIIAGEGGVAILNEIPSDAERKGFNPMDNSSLDSTKLQELGWKGVFDAETGFKHTVDILRQFM